MVTTDSLSKTFVENFKKAFTRLGFRRDQFSIQDSDESFYYYCFLQKPEIWARKIALFIFSGNDVTFSEMDQDKRTRPTIVTISHSEKITLPEIENERDMDSGVIALEGTPQEVFGSDNARIRDFLGRYSDDGALK